MSLDMELFYNAELLSISGIELATGMPSDSLSLINVLEPGHAVVGFFSPQPLAAGSYEVAHFAWCQRMRKKTKRTCLM